MRRYLFPYVTRSCPIDHSVVAVVTPLFSTLALIAPPLAPLMNRIALNVAAWQLLLPESER